MKVRELIKVLLDFNMEAEVTTDWSETVNVSYSARTDCNDDSDKKDTPYVFIDGCDLNEEDD